MWRGRWAWNGAICTRSASSWELTCSRCANRSKSPQSALARHRRSLALGKAARAQTAMGDNSKSVTFDRLKDRVHLTEAVATAEVELITDDLGEKLIRLDRDNEVE